MKILKKNTRKCLGFTCLAVSRGTEKEDFELLFTQPDCRDIKLDLGANKETKRLADEKSLLF